MCRVQSIYVKKTLRKTCLREIFIKSILGRENLLMPTEMLFFI